MEHSAVQREQQRPEAIHPRQQVALATPDFIKIEKNLTTLGFFTPSSKRIKNERSKTISFTRIVDGNKVEAKVTIAPSALFGLPITSDQDKYFALQRIVTDILLEQGGGVKNPISFTSAELLRLLNQGDAGKNFKDVADWLDVMTSTTIISEGAVYLAGKKSFAKDRFHIFDRAVSVGKELENGVIADKNYVWLSEWQLENINNNFLLPIDFDAYKQLKNHIAKALVPLLQIWLYASREEGSFEKRYNEICQILAVRQYKHLSEINRNFAPSLAELQEHGYIAAWKIEKTTDRKSYKIIFYHGEKFHRDRQHRLGKKRKPAVPQLAGEVDVTEQGSAQSTPEHPIVAELVKRGVTLAGARRLTEHLGDDQPVKDQLEWGDHWIAERTRSGEGIKNPPGFYIYLVQNNISVPENFQTSHKRRMYEESRAQASAAQMQKLILEDAYESYRKGEIDIAVGEMGQDQFRRIVEEKKAGFLQQFKSAATWEPEALEKVVVSAARSEVAKRISFTNFETFCQEQPANAVEPAVVENTTNPESDTFLTV